MAGEVLSLHRYPVKSMLGEDLAALELDTHGVVGDRALALTDPDTGRVATAKQPRHWRRLLTCASAGVGDDVRVTLPDGRTVDVPILCRIDTVDELEYFKNGGILQYVLRDLAA